MDIFDREWCNLFVWTVNGSSVFHIKRDREYWCVCFQALAEFWWSHVVPAKHALAGSEPDLATIFRYGLNVLSLQWLTVILDCRRLLFCLVLLAGNAPWQCQYCQANMQLFSHKSRHDCPSMVAKDYVCIAVALPRILAYIRSVTFRLSVILCCQPCMHHAVLFCRPDKEHATIAQIIALSKQMARDAPSTSFPPAKQRVQLAQRRRAPISM